MLFREWSGYVKCIMLFWQEYLTQFAYLGEDNPDPRMHQLRAHPDLQFALAIRNFQRFAGLNVTGL